MEYGKLMCAVVSVAAMSAMVVFGDDEEQGTRRIHTGEPEYATEIAAVKGCGSSLVRQSAHRMSTWVCADSDYHWYASQNDAIAHCDGRSVVDSARLVRQPERNTWRIMYGCLREPGH